MSDAFALFGLTPRFALERAALDAAFRAVQAEVHPDKFAHADAATQRQAVERATAVNEAYQTLKAPVARGAYLLRQAGIEPFDPANTRMSTAFLMQQIEWREQLESATDVAALEALEKRIAAAARDHEQRLIRQIDAEADRVGATETLRELRFIEKMGEEIQSAFETFDI
ncbi:MAG: Fe-S protein assembly co-chaperone HscB [Betaproteobacteria bacterium]|nr:Fe-S protein assembly co-chaperone HscB [Betaproteobacteria bacterium]